MLEGDSSAFSRVVRDSLSPWFTVWAIRHKGGLDRKLSANGRLVRWSVVIVCYSLGPRASSAAVRVSSVFIGLAFLCWPNFAYYLASPFEERESIEGKVSYARQSGSRWYVDYYFDFNGKTYGGTSKSKPISSLTLEGAYPEGSPVTVAFDPLNPERSWIVPTALNDHPGAPE